MGKIRFHIFLIFILMSGIFACKSKQNKMPDLRETYSYTDNNPFGASVAFAMLHNVYATTTAEISKKEFADNYGWTYDTTSLYFSIGKNYYPSLRDIDALLEFIYKGNTAFIAANNFDDALLNKLKCKQVNIIDKYTQYPYQQTGVSLAQPILKYKDSTRYFYYPFTQYLTTTSESNSRVVGINDNNNANLLVFYWGKGRIFLHNEPRAFSNYFLLTKNNYLYFNQLLQVLPKHAKENNEDKQIIQNVYWDNFYPKRNYPSTNNNKDGGSTFSEIFKHPPLKYAFLIGLSLLILFVLFGMKRKQRMVPIVKPTENTSIAFAEAIAGLYLSKKDNKVIADKIVTYFNEQIRTKYFLNIQVNDSSYADVLARKSGADYNNTILLTKTIQSINASTVVSDEQLLLLNGEIEKFFKNKK